MYTASSMSRTMVSSFEVTQKWNELSKPNSLTGNTGVGQMFKTTDPTETLNQLIPSWEDFNKPESYYRDLVADENFNLSDFINNANSSSSSTESYSANLNNVSADSVAMSKSLENLSSSSGNSVFTPDENGNTDRDRISNAVSSFVDSYNDLHESMSNSSDLSVLQTGAGMVRQTAALEGSLNRVGITINSDNTLNLNEDRLAEANVSDIEILFNGQHSFGDRMSITADSLYDTAAAQGASSFRYETDSTEVDPEESERLQQVSRDSDRLASAMEDLITDVRSGADAEQITASVQQFADTYNRLQESLSETNDSGVTRLGDSMTNQTNSLSGALENVGITVNADNTLSVDEEALSQASEEDLNLLFGDSNSYGDRLETAAERLSEKSTATDFKSYNVTGQMAFGAGNLTGSLINQNA